MGYFYKWTWEPPPRPAYCPLAHIATQAPLAGETSFIYQRAHSIKLKE